jgi:hypothetical protein
MEGPWVELETELGIVLILVSGPEAVIRQRVVLVLVARPRLPPQAFGVHACDRARARLATQPPPIEEPLVVREASPPSERRLQHA